METQAVIDAAMNDIALLNQNAKNLERLGGFYFQGKNTDIRFRLDRLNFFQLNKSSR